MARGTFTQVSELINGFPRYLEYFLSEPPFSRTEQLENHVRTIRLRRSIGSASEAIDSEDFLNSLYATLKSWGIGMRGSNLRPFDEFRIAIRESVGSINKLDGIKIDDPKTHSSDLSNSLWSIIASLNIVKNNAPIVAGTKALHHILPDLVVPVDRAYTQKFFGWKNPEFQYGQEKVFGVSFRTFAQVASKLDLEQFLSDGWCSSKTKIIDNAIIGFVCAKQV